MIFIDDANELFNVDVRLCYELKRWTTVDLKTKKMYDIWVNADLPGVVSVHRVDIAQWVHRGSI